jgi:predicted amidohydrolase
LRKAGTRRIIAVQKTIWGECHVCVVTPKFPCAHRIGRSVSAVNALHNIRQRRDGSAGCSPDTISSDIHVFSGNTPGMPYLPNVMSKFMAMGFSLEQVVTMATTAPAKIINRAPKTGTLQVGAPGDVAIMDLVEGPVTFVDTRNNKRDGKALLKPVQTVINGVPFGRPYQSPFAVR